MDAFFDLAGEAYHNVGSVFVVLLFLFFLVPIHGMPLPVFLISLGCPCTRVPVYLSYTSISQPYITEIMNDDDTKREYQPAQSRLYVPSASRCVSLAHTLLHLPGTIQRAVGFLGAHSMVTTYSSKRDRAGGQLYGCFVLRSSQRRKTWPAIHCIELCLKGW
ncbi:hypothetical protein B0T19DRAFT_42072 [Cercophora scortea]|uniref:Uncharacterized protein n=1 Tax=Cercophora scortea TaxID=314031 RepID=A0AAE0J4R0_9PEZI|nr:hypothetical protein B0T19DRAFT_42072 [Cercophora scortea]